MKTQNTKHRAQIKHKTQSTKLHKFGLCFVQSGSCALCSRYGANGFGLIEIIIVISIVTVTLFAFLQIGIAGIKLLRNEKENLEAVLLLQEAFEAVRSVRDESWTANIAPLSNGTAYYPVVENSKWKLAVSSPGLINGKYTRSISFEQVVRDGEDKISSAGTADPDTRKVTAAVSWNNKTRTIATYITNFQESLGAQTETKTIFFEGGTTDGDLANFPSQNAGNGDPAQAFTTTSAISVSKAELYLKRAAATPSNIYAELRAAPTGAVLGTSNVINSSTITNSAYSWVEFRFSDSVSLGASTKYYVRLRSIPSSNDAGSGSVGTIRWGYQQTASSPYSGGEARRYIGRLSNSSDAGQSLDQYDFGFRIYAVQ